VHFFIGVLKDFPKSVLVLQDKRDTMNLSQLSNLALMTHFMDSILYFSDFLSWQSFICFNDFDLYIGGRIHGGMIALSCSVPVLLLVDDIRLEELAKSMYIPHFRSLNAKLSFDISHRTIRDLLSIVSVTSFNGKLFDDNRRRVASIYIETFEHLGIHPSDELRKLANFSD
jgi:polysaccharide pyruvyl transferase WcaK-like protein